MPHVDFPAITIADCRNFVAQNVFKLRPQDYCRTYPKWPGLVGIELEMLPYNEASLSTDRPRLMPLFGENSVSSILLVLSKRFGWKENWLEATEETPASLLSIEVPDKGNISFEPGGQLEFSSLPFPCLSDALASLKEMQNLFDEAFAPSGIKIMQMGINPWQTVDEIGLQMQKSRYQAMDRYFTTISPFGRRMMRQTCTVQVNLDFGATEEQLAQRYVLSNLLAPFTTAMFAYSPVVNRTLTKSKSARAEAWRHIDPTRTGVLDMSSIIRAWDKASCVESYVQSVLNAPVIFIAGLNYETPAGRLTFREWIERPYKGVSPTTADFETHLSLHFMEVRPRGFLELRSVDCQSRVWQSAPTLFYTSLIYVEGALRKALDKLIPIAGQISDLLGAGTHRGLADPMIRETAQFLTNLALDGVNSLPVCFQGDKTKDTLQAFAGHFTFRGRSPADDVIDSIRAKSDGQLLPGTIRQLEEGWARLVT